MSDNTGHRGRMTASYLKRGRDAYEDYQLLEMVLFYVIDRKDVIYIESIGRKAVLHLEQETVEYYAKISRLEEQLRPAFFRVHRAYLVNLDYIESYTRREVRLKNAESVLISKYRIREFQKILAKKLEKG